MLVDFRSTMRVTTGSKTREPIKFSLF